MFDLYDENFLQIQPTIEVLQHIAVETLNQNPNRLELIPGFQIRARFYLVLR